MTTSEPRKSSKAPHALVMKGGGIKGLAYVGALKELEKYYEFDWFVGTSAGAITAVLLAAGYMTNELEGTLSKTNFRNFLDARFYKLPVNYYFYHGLFPGKAIKDWIDDLLSKKLLSEARGIRAVLLRHLPKRVTIYASRKDQDVLEFDSKTPETWETPAAHAVLCSMAIPIVFQPPQHHGGDVFDGGMQNNYPVEVFLRYHPGKPLVGLYLKPEKDRRTKRGPRLLGQLISIWTEAADIRALNAHINDTVIIDPRPIRTLQFGLQDFEKEFLLKVGRAAALAFLVKQNIPSGPTEELATQAAEEVENARAHVYEMRSKRRFRRWTQAFSGILVVVTLVISGVWLWNRENQQSNSNFNAPSASPITNQSVGSNGNATPQSASPEPSSSRVASTPVKSSDASAVRHISRARSLYASGRYQSALRECDNALRLDPNNRQALDLKNQIKRTIKILNS